MAEPSYLCRTGAMAPIALRVVTDREISLIQCFGENAHKQASNFIFSQNIYSNTHNLITNEYMAGRIKETKQYKHK